MSRMIVLHEDGERTETPTKGMPGLAKLQRVVGRGPIQEVPLFDSFEGERCQALCNADGATRRDLRANRQATEAWLSALTANGNAPMFGDDIIGPVVIVLE